MRRALHALLLAGSLLAADAAPASAATVTTRLVTTAACYRECAPPALHVTFTAAPGEQNRLVVRAEPDGVVLVEDAGATIGEEGACTARSDRAVACPPDARVAVALGDGDDTLVAAISTDADGGEGDDRLEGGPAFNALDGGPGADVVVGGARIDVLAGGPGTDRVEGGPGADVLNDADGGAFPDRYDGGPGRDVVGYPDRTSPLRIDLPAQVAAEDRLASIEGATGGRGDDVVVGGSGPSRLDGGLGADVVTGGDGDDLILAGDTGDPGDRVHAGAGDDQVISGAGEPTVALGPGDDFFSGSNQRLRLRAGAGDDRIQLSYAYAGGTVGCGSGRDVLAGPDDASAVLVPASCETVDLGLSGRVRLLRPLAAAAPLARVRSGCGTAFSDGCRVRIEARRAIRPVRDPDSQLWRREPLLGAASQWVRPGRRARGLRLRLSAKGRRLLLRRRELLVRVMLRMEPGRGPVGRDEWSADGFLLRLRAPGR